MSSRVTVSASRLTGLSRSAFSAWAEVASKAAHSTALSLVFDLVMALAFSGNITGMHPSCQFENTLLGVVLHRVRAQIQCGVMDHHRAGGAHLVAFWKNQQTRRTHDHERLSCMRGTFRGGGGARGGRGAGGGRGGRGRRGARGAARF